MFLEFFKSSIGYGSCGKFSKKMKHKGLCLMNYLKCGKSFDHEFHCGSNEALSQNFYQAHVT